MAIFHYHVAIVSKSNGHSAVASAAYQAKEQLTHEQQKIGSIAVNLDDPQSNPQVGKGGYGVTAKNPTICLQTLTIARLVDMSSKRCF